VAAANWMATARLAAQLTARVAGEALLIDVGSTTTDIVPLAGGNPCPVGPTDTERLIAGELVYTGLLRTPPASLAEVVPLAGGWCRVAPEHFAVTADVYRVLGVIEDAAYTVPTPDGRGTGRTESAARLARIVCSDLATLGMPAVEAIAAWIHDRQVARIADAVRQVLSRTGGKGVRVAIVAGIGAFLAEEAARSAGLDTARLASLLCGVGGDGWDQAAPSAALALLLAEAEGEQPLRGAPAGGSLSRGTTAAGGAPPRGAA
jgi:probable H4MPT-linked C1 transfer pathway protein